MENKTNIFGFVVGFLALGIIIVLGLYFIPWKGIHWGKLQLSAENTIVVIGQAEKQEKTEIATFSAGASAVNDNKDTAISEVNGKICWGFSSCYITGSGDRCQNCRSCRYDYFGPYGNYTPDTS